MIRIMTQFEADPSLTLNRIVKVADAVLAAIGPNKELWRLDIATLQNHPDLQGLEGLEVLGLLERGSPEQLISYGARRQSNPRVGGVATTGLREVRGASKYERYDEVSEVYASYLEARNITDTCHLCLDNGGLLNDAQLASEIRQGTARGKAVVETIIDGASNSQRFTLDEALHEFRQFIAGNAVSDSGGDERT